MPNYNDLRPDSDHSRKEFARVFPDLKDAERARIIPHVLRLRQELDALMPRKSADEALLLASWNIRELGHLIDRIPESYYYMAEIINRFDLVAIQEIKRTLDGLDILMRLLGDDWAYMITDVTEGNAGNRERFAYIYDKRKVEPSGLSGEIVLWDELTAGAPIRQLKRTPAITGFRAGWKEFTIINIHLHPGDDDDDQTHRRAEVELLLAAIHEKLIKEHFWNDNLIILGDTNLYTSDDAIVQLFTDAGFRESPALVGLPTNVTASEIYDRIFLRENAFFSMLPTSGAHAGGVLPVFDCVFREEDRVEYHEYMLLHKDDPSTLRSDPKFKSYYHRYWKRGQLSDHNPVWLAFQIDSSNAFLRAKLEQVQ